MSSRYDRLRVWMAQRLLPKGWRLLAPLGVHDLGDGRYR